MIAEVLEFVRRKLESRRRRRPPRGEKPMFGCPLCDASARLAADARMVPPGLCRLLVFSRGHVTVFVFDPRRAPDLDGQLRVAAAASSITPHAASYAGYVGRMLALSGERSASIFCTKE